MFSCRGLNLITLYVLCISGSSIPRTFTRTGGLIYDSLTDLTWQAKGDTTGDFAGATTYCEDLTSDGKTDWRIPDIRELGTIVDYSKYDPAIDASFDATSDRYWSSTEYSINNIAIWNIDFHQGNNPFITKDQTYYVRCVHQ